MRGYWDRFLATRFTNDDGSGGSGGGSGGDGGDDKGGSGGGGDGGKGGDTPPWGDEFKPEQAWATITNLRKSERELKSAVRTLTTKVEAFETKDKTESEKLQDANTKLADRVKELEGRERAGSLRSQVAEEAKKAGAIYPDDVYALVQEDLEVSDEGKARNASEVVKTLKASRPQLFGRANGADGNAGRGGSTPTGSVDINSMIRRASGHA